MSEYRPRDDLTEEKASQLFYAIVGQYQTAHEKEPNKTALHMINDIAMLEQVKEGCRQYIARNGVMVEWQNGKNQGGDRENPLLSKLNQTTEQQRKLLNELQLTPLSYKPPTKQPGSDKGDGFEDF